jgi:hypothetical protein
MSETRDPALGSWSIFEGNNSPRSVLEWSRRPGESMQRPVEWPVTLRVHFIREGVAHSLDVSVFEDLHFEYTRDSHNMRIDADDPRQPEATTGGQTFLTYGL